MWKARKTFLDSLELDHDKMEVIVFSVGTLLANVVRLMWKLTK